MFYFNLGIRHITDLQGYDHMLFLLALTLPLSFSLWKPTLKWITAFTVGHSISLAISALGWITLPAAWVEFSIAVTIALTVLVHLFSGFKVIAHGIWIAGFVWIDTWFWIWFLLYIHCTKRVLLVGMASFQCRH